MDPVIGLGLVQGFNSSIEGLRPFPALSGPGCEIPSTQADIWCWVCGTDRGHITHVGRLVAKALQPAFRCDRLIDGFSFTQIHPADVAVPAEDVGHLPSRHQPRR